MNESKVIINLDNIKHNTKELINKYNKYEYYFGVIKSNAYGHGEYIVNELIKGGINYIAVSYLREALEVRKYNKTIPILILEPINLDYLDIVYDNKLTITINTLDYLNKLINKVNKNIKVHIKLDTGLNRLGFKNKREVKEAVDLINENKKIKLEGIYSHFATVGIFDRHYDDQIRMFKILTSLIRLKDIPIVHFSSSVPSIAHPKLNFCNAVRFGIVLYGYNVSPTKSEIGIKNKLRNLRTKYYQKKYNISKTYFNVDLDLKRAMKFTTSIIEIKDVKINEYIGYGALYKACSNMKIAILPIGYNNGLSHNVDNKYVLINNKKYTFISIAMNMSMIKVDDTININDEVILLGDDITLGAFSRMNNYGLAESLINIGKNNTKVYIKNDKEINIKE